MRVRARARARVCVRERERERERECVCVVSGQGCTSEYERLFIPPNKILKGFTSQIKDLGAFIQKKIKDTCSLQVFGSCVYTAHDLCSWFGEI